MRTKKEIKLLPKRRTEQTYRVVLQHFEPEAGPHGRYRDVYSIRMESGNMEAPEKMLLKFKKAIADMFGNGNL